MVVLAENDDVVNWRLCLGIVQIHKFHDIIAATSYHGFAPPHTELSLHDMSPHEIFHAVDADGSDHIDYGAFIDWFSFEKTISSSICLFNISSSNWSIAKIYENQESSTTQ